MKRNLNLLFVGLMFHIGLVAQPRTDTAMDVYFKVNSFDLDAKQYSDISRLMASYPMVTKISGYADTSGSATNNLALAKKRAFAIYEFVKTGTDALSPATVTYNGGSTAMPIKWMNRRVQIRASKSRVFLDTLQKTSSSQITDTIRAFDLDNIYFVPDKPILSQESIPYIQQLARELKAIQVGTFEIVGHVNYQSKLDSSQLRDLYHLSELRAKAVYDYLQEFGIPAAKMKYKGVGNSKPVIPSPKNDEEKRKNMRVQILILK